LQKNKNKKKIKENLKKNKKHILSKFPVLFSEGQKKSPKKLKILIKNRQKIITIAYNVKACLRFFFI
jgi:tRNA A37 threonylcarbamoyladenosine dehydratase